MNQLARAAARFVLPSVCLACRVDPADDFFRGGVCAACWESLPLPEDARCARCDEALPAAPGASVCGRCLLDPPAFERLHAAAPYAGSARAILLAFKFHGADYLAARLAEVLAARLAPPRVDEVAAVPATRRARRRRGYHPADALGRRGGATPRSSAVAQPSRQDSRHRDPEPPSGVGSARPTWRGLPRGRKAAGARAARRRRRDLGRDGARVRGAARGGGRPKSTSGVSRALRATTRDEAD